MLCPNSQVKGSKEENRDTIIDEYINLRFKTCMLNSEFAEKVRSSENGHLFMKVLKERVVDELGLTAEPELEDMLFETRDLKS